MSDEETDKANECLQTCNFPRQPVFAERTAPDEPQVENGEIAGLYKVSLLVLGDLEKVKLVEKREDLAEENVWLSIRRPRRDGWFQQSSSCIELW